MAVLAAELAPPRSSAPTRVVSGRIALFLLVLTGLRLLAAGLAPLTEDEAYYRLWSQHLAFGYFDHPPMSAWWIALGQSVFGDTPFGARVVAVLATTAVSLLLVDMARLLGFSRAAADRTAVWYNSALLIALGATVVTPDAPATLFWTLTLWSLLRGERDEASRRTLWWTAAGVFAGLACLSKYSALFMGPGVLLWLAASREGRARLATPAPWIALLTAGVVFSPNLIWNAGHHWLSFAKQFSRIRPTGLTPRHVVDFPLTQFFLLNPLLAVFAVMGLRRVDWRSPNSRLLRLLPLGVLPFAAYLVLHSLHDAVQAHWPAPLYPTAALLAVLGAETLAGTAWRRAALAVPILGLSLAALAYAHILLPQTDVLGRKDPVGPLRGWPKFAADVERAREAAGASWTGTFSYGTAAELLAEKRTSAPVLELIERSRYLFEGRLPEPQGPGLVVDLTRRLGPEDLVGCFRTITLLPPLTRGEPHGPQASYRVYRVEGPLRPLAAEGCREGKDRTSPARS